MLQQSFVYPCVEKFIGFIFMYDVLGELCILMGALLHSKFSIIDVEIVIDQLTQLQSRNVLLTHYYMASCGGHWLRIYK